MKSKSELMRATRANRKKEGMVELRLWLTPTHRDLVMCMVNELKNDCFCDRTGLGVRGVTCGDCPKDYL